ncbi:MAG: DUF4351 domain-containing protein [Candidatus Parcubacteria bacterium]|nr:DUF4351 domain-containing protein [Leptolyngbyaceae cyanobacterium LF-bin-113]
MALSEAFLEWEQATQQRAEAQGLEQGLEQGQRSLILRQLEQRIGLLSQQKRDRISTLDREHLEAIAIALLDFREINDLDAWLNADR